MKKKRKFNIGDLVRYNNKDRIIRKIETDSNNNIIYQLFLRFNTTDWLLEKELTLIKKCSLNFQENVNSIFQENEILKKESLELTLQQYKEDEMYQIRSLRRIQENIKKYTEKLKETTTISDIEKAIKVIKKLPLVEKVSYYKNFIIIDTKNLTYKDKNFFPVFLGRYKIAICNNLTNVKVINKDFYCEHYLHPCINNTNSICFGDSFKSQIEYFLNSGNIDIYVMMLINFLEKPNYSDSYINISDFAFYYNKMPKFTTEQFLQGTYQKLLTLNNNLNQEKFNQLFNNFLIVDYCAFYKEHTNEIDPLLNINHEYLNQLIQKNETNSNK